MTKSEERQALGRSQLGRMLEKAKASAPAPERVAMAKEALQRYEKKANNVTPRDEIQPNNVTQKKRGRPKAHGSAAERQKAYRSRKESKP